MKLSENRLLKLNILFVLTHLMATVLNAQAVPAQLQVGEKLQYNAQFNIFPAGKATLSVIGVEEVNGAPAYHVQFSAKTGSFADRLYKVRDQIDTWLDLNNLITHRQVKSIREGDYRKQLTSNIFYTDGIAITNNDTIEISRDVRDPYSLFYYLRTIPLQVGDTFEFTAFDRNKLTDFQIKVDKKENVVVPAGTFTCLVIKPYRDGQTLFKNQGDMKIWFSDDAKKIPVKIQIKLKFGSMLLQLKSFTL
ncbi:MAG: DUF3108 domain-containing protein [Candidatus Neomarinimicrobiota bacterium]